jgi:hypothetical protein
MRALLALAGFSLLSAGAPQSAFATPFDVGSPVIDRPLNDSSVGVIYLYLGGTQPVAGTGFVTQWSFYDNEAGTNGLRVTPLVFELTGANQWTVVSIGTSRASNSSGLQSHPFSAIAGITALDPSRHYTFGFTHRGYTGTGANIVADGGYSGVVDFSGYNNYTDRWAYVFGTAAVGMVVGAGGLPLDPGGFGGRIYSASFDFDSNPLTPLAYCTSSTSTSGCVASMSHLGVPDISTSSGFQLRVTGVEPNKQGLIFYGLTGRAISPWAPNSTSYLCVKSPTQRMTLLNSGGSAGLCNGTFNIDWLAFLSANPASLGAPFSAGQLVNAQAWFRDPAAAKTTNLSNALEYVTQP